MKTESMRAPNRRAHNNTRLDRWKQLSRAWRSAALAKRYADAQLCAICGKTATHRVYGPKGNVGGCREHINQLRKGTAFG